MPDSGKRKKAEIIPKEPGQVMLPRDRRKNAQSIALLETISAVEIEWFSGFFLSIFNLRIIAPFIRKHFYYE